MQPGELYLQFTVAALGVLSKDIQDELGSIDNLQIAECGNRSRLCWVQVVIEDDQFDIQVETL